MKTVLLFVGLSASSVLTAQMNPPDSDANQSTPASQPVPPYQRPVSLGRIIPNIANDQSRIWLSPPSIPNERIVINKSPSQASPYTGESLHPVERDTEDCDS